VVLVRNILVLFCSLAWLAVPAATQTFEINPSGGAQATPAPQQRAQPDKKGQTTAAGGSQGSLAWGSNIEVTRTARAADMALRRNDYTGALTYAERAAHAAPQDINMWLMYGYAARGSGHFGTAVEAYQHALQLNSNSVEGLSGLAQTYVHMGKNDQAKALLNKVIALNPKRTNDLMVAGELFIQTGAYDGAATLLQRANSIAPSPRADLLTALAYQKLKKPDQARMYLERARARAPRNPEVLRAMAGYFRESRDYAQAVTTLQSIPGHSPDVMAEVGYTYELWGKRIEAADNYSAAANAAPKVLSYQLSAASSNLAVADTKRARVFLDRAAEQDPNYYRVHAIHAEVARSDGKSDEAIKEYTLALQTLPEATTEGPLYPLELRMSLAEEYKTVGDQAGALSQYTTMIAALQQMNIEGLARPEFLRLRGATKANLDDPNGAEADLKEAASLDPTKPDILLQYGSVLWKIGKKKEAQQEYEGVLRLDSKNEWALTALGYLARDMDDVQGAEKYFNLLAQAHPNNYAGYLALGDMYTALHRFLEANDAYERGWKLAPTNPLLVAGGANVGIEWHKFDLSKKWLDRVKTDEMRHNSFVLRERERYLTWVGQYAASAQVAQEAMQKLPKDRDVAVYLGYDLLYLGRYDDLFRLTSKYEKTLPQDADLPLLAGYVHKSVGLLHEAADDFSRAIQRGPKVTTAYVNRGYVYNDLQNAEAATLDFEQALKLEANNGSAHLGLAFAQLELRHPRNALDHALTAQKILGESAAIHDALATGYQQQGLLANAEREYMAALKYSPDDAKLQLALADTQYHERKYSQAIASLTRALDLSPDDPFVYAQMAHAYAQLKRRDDTLRYIQMAERMGSDESEVLLATGDALLVLGDAESAMGRFASALDAPDSDRVQARLAIAKVMLGRGKWDDAREQVGLAFAESRIGEASPITVDHLIQAADMSLRMHDFDAAIHLFERARDAGAADQVVAIGEANTYLERGDTTNAQVQLASLGNAVDMSENYDYMLAEGNLYRQQHRDRMALSAFARANLVAGQDEVAEHELLEAAGEQGMPVTDRVSVSTVFENEPIFEDSTIYQMEARLNGGAALPPPWYSTQTQWLSGFRVHQNGVPPISGLAGYRKVSGTALIPAEGVVINRSTNDYLASGALNPVLHVGHASLSFNTGLQFTIRRDSLAPVDMNQNLFRQFVYLTSSPLGNWLTIRGEGIHETGPFTLRDLHSREFVARLDFEVGRPWGRTKLLTGYLLDDLMFRPLVREWFRTDAYIGVEHRFSQTFKLRLGGAYTRGWRVQDTTYVIAQAARPGAEFSFIPAKNWTIDGKFYLSRGMGLHDYDNMRTGLLVSYTHRWRRDVDDGVGSVPVDYPIRFSAGLEHDDFYNFTGSGNANIMRPVIKLTIF
jgi:tetratricopeptide (TPR) repeat protein